MKIRCDICGGALIVGAGGQHATCKVCGMEHSIERVREMLGMEIPVVPDPPIPPTPPKETIETVEVPKSDTSMIEEPLQRDEPLPIEEEEIIEEAVPEQYIEEFDVLADLDEYEERLEPETIEDAVFEVIAEPAVEVIAEPVIEVIAEPVVEIIAETVVEEAAEPAVVAAVPAEEEIPLIVTRVAQECKEDIIPHAHWEAITEPAQVFRGKKRAVYNPEAEVYITSPNLKSLPEAYFESLLVYLYPQFDIYKDVVVNEEYNRKVDFMIENNGKPLLGIIFCHANDYNSTQVLLSMSSCINQHISCIRFFTNFANKPDYVRDRIDHVRAIRLAK